MDTRGHMRAATVIFFLAIGCGPQVAIDEPDADTTGDASTTSGAPSVTFTSSGPPPATTSGGPTTSPPDPSDTIGDVDVDDATGAESLGFIPDPTGCGVAPEGTSFHCSLECSTYLQDCPEGEKCMPWANDGGPAWNATRCSPVAADPGQLGESCEVEGSGVSGLDDCDVGLMCFWVDPRTLEGTCLSLCGGTPDDPSCAADHTCQISAGGQIDLCLAHCDPLVDDCLDGHCTPTSDAFVCGSYAPGEVLPGSACEYANACVPGSACIPADFVDACDGASCCSSFCDLQAAEPDAPCLPGQACAPWWEGADAPEPWTHVGVCALPQ
jgi:hypothetical protein